MVFVIKYHQKTTEAVYAFSIEEEGDFYAKNAYIAAYNTTITICPAGTAETLPKNGGNLADIFFYSLL